jgi:hypothetical protein
MLYKDKIDADDLFELHKGLIVSISFKDVNLKKRFPKYVQCRIGVTATPVWEKLTYTLLGKTYSENRLVRFALLFSPNLKSMYKITDEEERHFEEVGVHIDDVLDVANVMPLQFT